MIDTAVLHRPMPIFSKGVSYTPGIHLLEKSIDDLGLDEESFAQAAVLPFRERLHALSYLDDNWDGRGSAKPNQLAVAKASALSQLLFEQASRTHYAWQTPFVSSNEEGDVLLEWWYGQHKLSIYLAADSVHFLRVWGPNVADEMDDGELVGDQFIGLWRWLHA